MPEKSAVFEKHYKEYLKQIADLKHSELAHILGVTVDSNGLAVPYFRETFHVSAKGVIGPEGQRPHYGTCVILCKYLLLCPQEPAIGGGWKSYKDFKDAGPLITYFSSNVEHKIANHFKGRLTELKQAASPLGGRPPTVEDLPYDYCVEFDPLPRIPCLLAFNDADEEFPADCRVLFTKSAEAYLDMECVAMIGAELANGLVQ